MSRLNEIASKMVIAENRVRDSGKMTDEFKRLHSEWTRAMSGATNAEIDSALKAANT